MLLLSWPLRPRTTVGWMMVFVFGPPPYFAGEGFIGWVISPEHGRRLAKAAFSPLRILVALACVLLALGAVWFVQSLFDTFL
jgi:hypothetical protein